MAVARSDAFLKDLRTLYAVGSIGSVTDGQLLDRFVTCRDEAAFEALVERHGRMVLQICRGFLGNAHDAEDAFQATFLVLARQAGSIRKRDSVASWLFGVAGRIAVRARVDAARRRKYERRAAEVATRTDVH
jgi:DNA-directed RNA polymerase specialized sigma24 family protein